MQLMLGIIIVIAASFILFKGLVIDISHLTGHLESLIEKGKQIKEMTKQRVSYDKELSDSALMGKLFQRAEELMSTAAQCLDGYRAKYGRKLFAKSRGAAALKVELEKAKSLALVSGFLSTIAYAICEMSQGKPTPMDKNTQAIPSLILRLIGLEKEIAALEEKRRHLFEREAETIIQEAMQISEDIAPCFADAITTASIESVLELILRTEQLVPPLNCKLDELESRIRDASAKRTEEA